MTYRGTYRCGVIVPGDPLNLPEGARVDFSISRSRSAARGRRAARRAGKSGTRRMTAAQRVEAFMQGFGLLRASAALKGKSTAAVARELRRRSTGARVLG